MVQPNSSISFRPHPVCVQYELAVPQTCHTYGAKGSGMQGACKEQLQLELVLAGCNGGRVNCL
jgi:hypothetical protein